MARPASYGDNGLRPRGGLRVLSSRGAVVRRPRLEPEQVKAELPYYYSLFDDFTLCGNYFCSVLGPTWPNRFYLAAGTSGGITTNGVWGYGVFDYPIILDLLEAAGVTWKVYNIGWDSVPFGNTDNVFVFWQRWAHEVGHRWHLSSCAAFSWLCSLFLAGFLFLFWRCPSGAVVVAGRACPAFA